MKLTQKVQLTIPNQVEYLPVVNNAVTAMASILGFDKNDVIKIELGIEEAIVNILNTAFLPGEKTTFDVILQPLNTGLKIILKEKGIPFDPKTADLYDPEKLKETLSEKGLGIFLMKQFFEKVSFLNLGKEGKETHLFKNLNNHPVRNLISDEELDEAREAKYEEPLPRNSVRFNIRGILKEETIEISKCAYSSYGYTYINEDIYFPDRIWDQNEAGELISLVPVTDDGKIMGHAALEIEERDPLFPQLGMAFVMPRYQGQGCMSRVVPRLINKAREMGFTGIYARGITAHPFSQKSLLKFNLKETAILLSSGPGREYKGIDTTKAKRESVVLLSLYLKKISHAHFYAPEKHQPMIKQIYKNLGVEIKFNNPEMGDYVEGNESVISINTENVNNVAHVTIKKYGPDIPDEIKRNLRLLCIDRFETIYLHLNMNNPSIIKYIDDFENLSFFFAGIMPASKGRNELILQYLNNFRVDYDKIAVASEMAKALKEYIRKSDPDQGL